MIGTDDLRRAVQIAGAGVISKAGPGRHHILGRRRSKVVYRRPSAGEIQKIGDHRGHDGLLKHDFRQPHMIGRRQLGPAPPPGKRASMPVIPGKYPRCRKISMIHGAETGTAPRPVQLRRSVPCEGNGRTSAAVLIFVYSRQPPDPTDDHIPPETDDPPVRAD